MRRLFSKLTIKGKKPLPEAYPKILATIGDHIRKTRLDRELFQADVAKIMNVTEECISNWEINKSHPNIMYWPRIIKFLGYDPEYVEGNTLAIVLANYRRQHGLRLRRLAEQIGVDETTILWWERGKEVKYKRSKRQLEEFFTREGISDVEIPFFDSVKLGKENYQKRMIRKK